MNGIDLNRPIRYQHSSLRYFAEREYHIDRCCEDDVLLLVFKGVLRFSEDGTFYEIGAGEYYIQHRGGEQRGVVMSDSPQYLYVHFTGEWSDGEAVLPRRGRFDIGALKPLLERMDRLAHGDFTLAERSAVFGEILSRLYRDPRPQTAAEPLAVFMERHLAEELSLDRLSDEFHFSKNHIIALFKKAYGTTPTCYWNELKLRKAKHLLEATSEPAETIATSCGFNNYSHFYRLFLRENGVSPTKWREQTRIKP